MSFKYVGAFTLDIFWPLVAHSGKTLPHIWPLPSCSYSEKRIRQTFDHGLNAPLYTWHRQNCCLAPYSQIGSSAAVLSKQTEWLTFWSSHIWIQLVCTLLLQPNVYILPHFDRTLICPDRARAIHPYLWWQICHFGQIFEFRGICQGKSSFKGHICHLLWHKWPPENFIWAQTKTWLSLNLH